MSYSNLHLSLGRCYSNNHKSHWKVYDGYTNNKVLNGYIKATNKPPNTRNKIHNSKHIELHYYSLRDIENSIDLIIKESLANAIPVSFSPIFVGNFYLVISFDEVNNRRPFLASSVIVYIYTITVVTIQIYTNLYVLMWMIFGV